MKMTSVGIGTLAQGERAFALLKNPWQAVLIVGVIQNWTLFWLGALVLLRFAGLFLF